MGIVDEQCPSTMPIGHGRWAWQMGMVDGHGRWAWQMSMVDVMVDGHGRWVWQMGMVDGHGRWAQQMAWQMDMVDGHRESHGFAFLFQHDLLIKAFSKTYILRQ